MAIQFQTITKSTEIIGSLAEVREGILAAAKSATPQAPVEVVAELGQASYLLTEPFVLSAKENPELSNVRVTLKAATSMRPIVTSCVPITETYEKVEGKPYYKCQLEKDENGEYPRFHDLYFKGQRLKMATSPIWHNKEALTWEERVSGSYGGGDGTWMSDDFYAPCDRKGLYAPVEIAEQVLASESDATELCMYVQWEHYTLRVKGVDLSDTKEFDGKSYALITFDENFVPFFIHGMHRANNMMGRITFFRNDLAFLTEKNTYVYDWNNGVLYFIAEDAGGFSRYKLMRPTLDSLFVFEGLSGCTVEGLVFTGVSSSYVCDNGYYALLSNLERRLKNLLGDRLRHAAIVGADMKSFTVKDCEFRGIGCNAVQLCDRTVRADIRDNIFIDVAMSGVSIGNPTSKWENPENRSFGVSVVNNYFEHISYDYPNAAAIFLGISDGSLVSRNTIKGCGYSGIYGGWGWSSVGYEPGERVNLRGAEISYNKIIDFMELCRDGAAIYMTGGNAVLSYTKRLNSIHHNFASLSVLGNGDTIGYYLDGSSSHWTVEDNVIHNCRLPLYNQYNIACQYSHHCTIKNFYSTTPVHESNHRPHHDVYMENAVWADGLEELFRQYPEAKAIMDGAGCKF